jgi:hypothetical protein
MPRVSYQSMHLALDRLHIKWNSSCKGNVQINWEKDSSTNLFCSQLTCRHPNILIFHIKTPARAVIFCHHNLQHSTAAPPRALFHMLPLSLPTTSATARISKMTKRCNETTSWCARQGDDATRWKADAMRWCNETTRRADATWWCNMMRGGDKVTRQQADMIYIIIVPFVPFTLDVP